MFSTAWMRSRLAKSPCASNYGLFLEDQVLKLFVSGTLGPHREPGISPVGGSRRHSFFKFKSISLAVLVVLLPGGHD